MKSELDNLGINYGLVELGEVEIKGIFANDLKIQLKADLLKSELELMEDRKSILIKRIKKIVVAMIHYTDEIPKTRFSDYLFRKMDYDYTYLLNLFSSVAGTTIEHFIMARKIDRVKELLVNNELTLSEIA